MQVRYGKLRLSKVGYSISCIIDTVFSSVYSRRSASL